jgi:hypothetical protein
MGQGMVRVERKLERFLAKATSSEAMTLQRVQNMLDEESCSWSMQHEGGVWTLGSRYVAEHRGQG